MHPKVSVIVPVYNVEDYLERCLDSIIYQTYRNLEIILVNDGSTDSSGKICDEYAQNDNRIIVIHKENQGVSIARNTGMDICTGEYLAFVDSDDYIHPETYASCVYVMQKEDVDFIEFGLNFIFNIVPLEPSEPISYEIHNQEEVIRGRIKIDKHLVFSVNKLYKKDFMKDIKFPLVKIAEDDFLFNSYAFKINRVAIIPLKFYNYYMRQGSAMRCGFTIDHTNSLKARVELYKLLENKFPHLLDIQLEKIITNFYDYLKSINNEKNDKNMYIRKTLVNILSQVLDDIMLSNYISNNIKEDLKLALKSSEDFITKNKNGIIRK